MWIRVRVIAVISPKSFRAELEDGKLWRRHIDQLRGRWEESQLRSWGRKSARKEHKSQNQRPCPEDHTHRNWETPRQYTSSIYPHTSCTKLKPKSQYRGLTRVRQRHTKQPKARKLGSGARIHQVRWRVPGCSIAASWSKTRADCTSRSPWN